jgi:hypothetical protein
MMKQSITQAFDGYAVSQVRLEGLVDASGYKPVMDALVTLNEAEPHTLLTSAPQQFLQALSPKTQGLLLTSALMSDNQVLYKPLYEIVKPNIRHLYSQDVPSLLGGAHAPSAITEMTCRAATQNNALELFSQGLSQIASSFHPGQGMAGVKGDISSSSWVEKHPQESRALMTIVDAAPATSGIKMLKENALGRYLKSGLKLGAAAAALTGLTFATLYGSSFAHKATNVSLVDLGARPTIESVDAKGNVEQRKVVAYGEVGSLSIAQFYLEKMSGQSVTEAIGAFSDGHRLGEAMLVKESDSPDICVVQADQIAPVSKDGNFYLFSEYQDTISDKNLSDFYLKSHEASHCFNLYTKSQADSQDLNVYEVAYAVSLNEISSDLGAILDYMIETGKDDIYANHIRPQRISTVDDLTHKTAWALDIILKDVDPAAMQMKSKEDIPKITRYLMEKHFMAKDGTFSPGKLGSQGTTSINTPAANALFSEIIASKTIGNQRYPELVSRLKADIRDTLSAQQSAYAGVAPQDILDRAASGYEQLAKKYDLEPLQVVQVKKAEISPRLDSMMSAFL